MVQKKSNSILNSGATQRVTDDHVFRQRGNHLATLERNQISLELTVRQIGGLPRLEPPPLSRTALAFLDFLAEEFGCTELKWLPKQGVRGRYSYFLNSSFFCKTIMLSLNKKNRWMLPELLENLFQAANSNSAILPRAFPTLYEPFERFKLEVSDSKASATHPKLIGHYSYEHKYHLDNHCANRNHEKRALISQTSKENLSQLKNKKRLVRKRKSRKNKFIGHQYVDHVGSASENDDTYDVIAGNLSRLSVQISRDIETDARDTTVKTQLKKFEIHPYNAPRVALCKGKHSNKKSRYGPVAHSCVDLEADIRDGMLMSRTENTNSQKDEFNTGLYIDENRKQHDNGPYEESSLPRIHDDVTRKLKVTLLDFVTEKFSKQMAEKG